MHKCFYLLLIFVIGYSGTSFAQKTTAANVIPSGVHKYFIYIQGVNTRADVISLEDNIGKMPGIKYFRARRFPVMYFLLVTDNAIPQTQFDSWLDPNLYKTEIYGEDEKHQGMCVMRYRQNQKH